MAEETVVGTPERKITRRDYERLVHVLRAVVAARGESVVTRDLIYRGCEQVLREARGRSVRDQQAYDFVVDYSLPPGSA